jgi:hypothetical protein
MAVTLPSSSNNRLKLNPPKQQQQIERRLHANTESRSRMERHLAKGSGRLKLGSGAFVGAYSFKSRFEDGQSATNPEIDRRGLED